MNKITIIFACLLISSIGWSQSLTSAAGTAVSQAPGSRTWSTVTNATGNPNGTSTTAGVINPGNPNSEVLTLTNFNFAALPSSITIQGISVSVTRSSTGGTARDLIVELIKGGTIQPVDNKANTTNWPVALTAITYGNSTDLWLNTWTRADIVAANFGVAISVQRNGSNTTASIDAVTITVNYLVITPIILTSFDILKLGNGHVDISFSTSSEEKIKWFVIQRSADGQDFTDLFTLEPKGGENMQQHYRVTDPFPLPGISYYRLKEIDIDDQSYFFNTRTLQNSGPVSKLRAFFAGGSIRVNINKFPGNYTLSLFDMNGVLLNTRNLKLTNQAYHMEIIPPEHRTGIYLVNLKGNAINETVRVYIDH